MNSDQIMHTTVDLLTKWGLKVIGAVALLIIGRIIAGALRRIVRKWLARAEVDETLVPFLCSLVYYLALAVIVIAVLGLFGVQTTSLVAVLGAAGLAIGLALQGTLSHFASGIMLLIFRPFKVDDYVEVGGTGGTVVEVGIFSTVLKSPDNIKITVPNSQIYGSTIRNFHGYDTRRVDLVIGISYGDDIGLACETIRGIVTADGRVLAEPELRIAVSEMGDSSVNLIVRPWCQADDYWPLRWDLLHRIKEGLESSGCTIPFPQRDVHLYPKAV